MKKLFGISILALTSCTIFGPTYTGETTADSLLRSDTERNLSFYFRSLHDCNPEKIHTKVDAIPRPNAAEETWELTGCGHTDTFKVNYIPDGVGGTYIQFKKVYKKMTETSKDHR